MSNMGYCRFQNTVSDLRDCEDHLGDPDLSDEEAEACRQLIQLCVEISTDYGGFQ